MVLEFHQKYGSEFYQTPTLPSTETLLLRSRLIAEEAAEFISAASQKDMEGMTDAICDLLYVVYGSAVALGVDIEPCFAEVQRSNMSKDGGGRDGGGKVRKGADYFPPDIKSELVKQGWLPK